MGRLMYYDTNSGQFFPYDDVPTAHTQINTNYETLQQMSEEELAEWLSNIYAGGSGYIYYEKWLNWLRSYEW